MNFTPSASVDLSRFDKPHNELEGYYGLPRDVKFCKKCNMSNQQPMSSNEYEHSSTSSKTTMQFDENGVCHACNFNELKWEQEIDWDEREKELIELCDQYRKTDGSYDCIVGGSGGKDSAMQSHLLKYKYGMNPRQSPGRRISTQTSAGRISRTGYMSAGSTTTSTRPTARCTDC